MAFCRYCGNKLNDGDTVCANCGNEVKPIQIQEPQENNIPEEKNPALNINSTAVEWNCQEMCSQRIPKILDRQESGGMMSRLG